MELAARIPKYIAIDRTQTRWDVIDWEKLIPSDHAARAIWEMAGRLDLRGFEEDVKSHEGESGRPRWPPRLLLSVWVYAYTQGVSSVRRIEQMIEEESGMRWLCGGEKINYHTLSSFRMERKEHLDGLFTQVLAVLESEELIDLSTVMQDGTKVRAQAGKDSFHRRRTLEDHLERARTAVEDLHRQSLDSAEGSGEAERKDTRVEAARKRAAREKVARMEASLQQLSEREAEVTAGQKGELRVSESEAEARKMKQNDGGWAPGYNVQTSTEARNKFLVAVSVTQDANDMNQLVAAAENIERTTGQKPLRIVADNGYVSRDNIREMAEREIELVAPWKEAGSREAGALKVNGIDPQFRSAAFGESREGVLICPAGKPLPVLRPHQHHGERCVIHQAAAEDCAACANQPSCCGKKATARQVHRIVEGPEMEAYLERMAQPATQELYKRRKAVAETPHMWWKAIFGWRQFSVRGLKQAAKEAVWLGLAYNIQQWIRIRRRSEILPVAA